ncbi:Rha family transcriptional regulator [Xanthobacter sp. DSM 24535]|uniref:Rha family transcriptional regulator n=1 Tax=Roseixanthobacter psychrophilus TaxID=3119917 RepID=UPI003726CD9B
MWSDTDAHVITDDILPITGRTGGERLTMSSREIAELLGNRHDKVKQSIIRLAERGVVVHPPMGEEHFKDALGRPRSEIVYRLDKRSSLIVVAQLSPEFTARVVDRWQELEAQVVAPRPKLPDFTNPAGAAGHPQGRRLHPWQHVRRVAFTPVA